MIVGDGIRTERQQPIYPPSVSSVVSELFQRDTAAAEQLIWRELQNKDGAVWHRQHDRELAGLARSLQEILPRLKHGKDNYAAISKVEDAEKALERAVDGSQLVTHDLLSAQHVHLLKNQFREMYRLIHAMTGKPEAIIDLRIETSGAYIENFHQDFGTALLMSLVGPGPHFIHPNNQPQSHDGAFFREDLPHPEQVFEVPPCSMLAMRGRFSPDDTCENPSQGLWHSSPCKQWNGAIQWDTRVLLIVTSPESAILPPRPSLDT